MTRGKRANCCGSRETAFVKSKHPKRKGVPESLRNTSNHGSAACVAMHEFCHCGVIFEIEGKTGATFVALSQTNGIWSHRPQRWHDPPCQQPTLLGPAPTDNLAIVCELRHSQRALRLSPLEMEDSSVVAPCNSNKWPITVVIFTQERYWEIICFLRRPD